MPRLGESPFIGCFTVFTNEENVNKLAEKDKGLLKRIKDFFSDFLDRIKNALEKLSVYSKEYRSLHNDVEAVEHIVKLFNEALEEYQGKTGTKADNKTDYAKKRVASNKRTVYNEFNTEAMKWAHSNNTNVGDAKIINRKGNEFVLIEATKDGYIELATGNTFKELRDYYEQLHKKEDYDFYGSIEEFGAVKRPSMWNNVNDENGRNGARNTGQVERQGLQDDSAIDNEYLRRGNKIESSVDYSRKTDSKGNELTEQQQEYFADSKVRDENGAPKYVNGNFNTEAVVKGLKNAWS